MSLSRIFWKAAKILLGLYVLAMLYPVGYYVLHDDFYEHRKGINFDDYKNKPINQGTWGVYVINLDRAADRWQYVRDIAAKLDATMMQRVSAVDGASLSNHQIQRAVDAPRYKRYMAAKPKLGAIGCYLSHIDVWQRFMDSNLQYAVILEDDVSFRPEILNPVIADLMAKPRQWDIVNFDSKGFGMPISISPVGKKNHKLVSYLSRVFNAGGYIINRDAAQKLLTKSLPITMYVDEYFTRSWELGIKFAGVEPRLVRQTFGDSYIETKDSDGIPVRDKKSFTDKMRRSIYLMQSALLRFVYGIKIYWQSKEAYN